MKKETTKLKSRNIIDLNKLGKNKLPKFQSMTLNITNKLFVGVSLHVSGANNRVDLKTEQTKNKIMIYQFENSLNECISIIFQCHSILRIENSNFRYSYEHTK